SRYVPGRIAASVLGLLIACTYLPGQYARGCSRKMRKAPASQGDGGNSGQSVRGDTGGLALGVLPRLAGRGHLRAQTLDAQDKRGDRAILQRVLLRDDALQRQHAQGR